MVQRITDLAVLDRKLAEIAASPEGPHAHFGEFYFDMSLPNLNPLSNEYRLAVLEQYQRLTGRKYSTDFEEHPFDVGSDHDFLSRPWPYNTGDASQVGQLLLSIGFVISTFKPKAGERILEMGAGWGNVCLPLAQMGCAVMALDIEDRYIKIISHRAQSAGVPIRTVKSTFLSASENLHGERFDSVIFHAAFHHCDDHLALLRLIDEKLLVPQGRLVLAGEPLNEELPYPWGMNNLGEGLWAIRKFGWHELVFRPSYLINQALPATGFKGTLTVCPQTSFGNTIIAVRN